MDYMTAQQVADMLQVKVGKIYELKAEGKIPYLKVGGALRFDRADIKSWLDEHKKPVIN